MQIKICVTTHRLNAFNSLNLSSKKMRFLRIISPHVSRNFKCAPQSSRNIAAAWISARDYCAPSQQQPSERVSAIVEEMTGLTLLEVADLTEALRQKMGVKEMPSMFVMMPGMGFSVKGGAAAKGGGGGGPGKAEEKAEKVIFDLKLEGYDAVSKIKVIKEVKGFTGLGLKESKELVEKAPGLMKKGVTKEEAETIIAKMKAAGAQVSME